MNVRYYLYSFICSSEAFKEEYRKTCYGRLLGTLGEAVRKEWKSGKAEEAVAGEEADVLICFPIFEFY